MKKDTIKFSIICPLYNCEDFIENCIKSVLNQAYTNWELIIINDGSTDKGPEICRSFMSDNRIRLINQNNQGQFKARNNGLKLSSGDYILFLDSDDYLAENALLFLACKILEYKQDVIYFSYDFDANCQIDYDYFLLKETDIVDYSHDPILEVFCKRIGYYLWDKCYKAEITKNIFNSFDFSFTNFAEDTLLLFEFLKKAKSISVYNDKLYNYRFRPSSTMNRLRPEDYIGRNNIYLYIYSYLLKNSYDINPNVISVYDSFVVNQIFRILYLDKKRRHLKELYYRYKKYNLRPRFRSAHGFYCKIIVLLFNLKCFFMVVFLNFLKDVVKRPLCK